MIEFAYISILSLLVFLSLKGYILFAKKKNITARINFRTLHKKDTPKGGGLIFSGIFLLSLIPLNLHIPINKNLLFAFLFSGTVITLYGFADDILNIRRYKKFITLSLFSLFPILFFNISDINFFGFPDYLIIFLSWFVILWFLNAYNFIDGIDGLATFIAIFIFLVLSCLLFFNKTQSSHGYVSGLLAISCCVFFIFNKPPAKIFMGDSGSLFLGNAIVILLITTVESNLVSIWTWLILLSYILGETTTTSLLRLILVSRWYGAHRSHAYQNLARITDNHGAVLIGVASYHILWLLPLAIVAFIFPMYGKFLVLPAILPIVILNFIYGPLYSSK